eukprot:TRINITY_DN186_c0_g2_i1.p1 TRINITY_DN186_c0_g2~~TRINITY_DN186_c0_g2_i1.p1  ORF type:complete len:316 (-),score=103.41 TRINITY_DN186_c0_g2_i1:14-961(-)
MFTSIEETKTFNLLLSDFSIIEREELFLMDARTSIFESANKMREEFAAHRDKLIEMEKQKQKGNFFNNLFTNSNKKKIKEASKRESSSKLSPPSAPNHNSAPIPTCEKKEDREMLGIRVDPRLSSSPLSTSPATSPPALTPSNSPAPVTPRERVIITKDDDELEKKDKAGWDLLRIKKKSASDDKNDRDEMEKDKKDKDKTKNRDLSPFSEVIKGRSRASSMPNDSRFRIEHSSPTQEALQEILQAETWNSFPVISALLHRYIKLDDPDEVFTAVVYFLLQRGKILGLLETVFREEIENPDSRTCLLYTSPSPRD